jgi:folate-dependent phosphoribosylglycinamide formyltransferase PurN
MYAKLKNKRWIACFSRTGYELYSIIKNLQILPDLVVCNQSPATQKIDSNLRQVLIENNVQIVFTSKAPTIEEYKSVFGSNTSTFITLHGWMRIIPPAICTEYTIYNGHPGLVTKYPILKGKDPQKKAFELKHKTIGTVIHEVISEVDDGRVLSEASIKNTFSDLDSIFNTLREISIVLWVDFLKNKFKD